MPIYEYRCGKGHEFEVMQRMSDDPIDTCETCSAPAQKVFRPIAVHFKGSGFYSTDYGSSKRARELKEAAEGTGKHAKDEGSGESKSTEKSDSTSESKSESKSDSKSESKSESKPASSGGKPESKKSSAE